jgi:hypothetical protein
LFKLGNAWKNHLNEEKDMLSFKAKKLSILLSVLLVSGSLAGCVAAVVAGAAVAGAGTYTYVKGELKTSVGANIKQTSDATLAALHDYGIVVVSQQLGASTGEINGRRADDTKVVVKLNEVNPGVTEIGVRVGLVGDEATSRNILDKVQSYLKMKS